MLRLQCKAADDFKLLSRVAVLNIGLESYDYGLITGHGVPPDRPCQVLDFEGRSAPVSVISLAQNYKIGAQTDWALIRFEKINTPRLIRYDLVPFTDTTALDNMRVEFAQARGLPENRQSCNLEILDFSENERRVSHNCRSVPGQSGTPVTRRIDDRDTLVGLHIGQLWMLESPRTGRPDKKGYINLFNVETVDEIKALIETYS